MRTLSPLLRPLALSLAIVACGGAAPDGESGESEFRTAAAASFVRPVVMRTAPLSLSNPNGDPVTWPIWGGAFTLDRTVQLRASLDARAGAGGLLFGGRGDPEHADTDQSVAVAIVAKDGGWVFRELAGAETVQEIVVQAPAKTEIVLAFPEDGKSVKLKTNRKNYVLTLQAPLASSVGTYLQLEPSAELGIDEIAITQPLPKASSLGAPLRTLAAERGVAIGSATDVWPPLHDASYEALLAEQFDTAAPTEFYWPTTRGEDKDYFFVPADLMVNFATVHQQKINGYFLTWDFELPQWVNDVAATGDTSALGQMLDDHIKTLVGRYKGRMNAWVVANEAIWGPDEGGGARGKYAESIWSDVLGPEYIARAFRVAHAADPNAKLLYNETGAESLGAKSDFLFTMAKGLVEDTVPIDGIGFQFHLDSKKLPKMADVKANLERFAALGLDIYITELDVSLEGRRGTKEEKEALQANVYADVLKICLAVPKCRSYTVFGFGDKYAWDELGDASPLLFDESFQPKPAFFSVQSAFAPQ